MNHICTICKSENMRDIEILKSDVCLTEGSVTQTVSSFVCLDCGHVDLYASQSTINMIISREEKEAEHKKLVNELESKIIETENKIAELTKIINDEDRTVREVNAAKDEISMLNSEISRLKNNLHNEQLTNRMGIQITR